MILSDDRKSHFAHIITDVLYEDDLVDFSDDSNALRAAKDGIEFFEVRNIARIESSSSYCILHLISGKNVTVTRLLKDFEEMLLSYRFFRIHHSHLINLDYIKKYIRSGQVEMENGDLIDVSRRKKEEFLKLLSR